MTDTKRQRTSAMAVLRQRLTFLPEGRRLPEDLWVPRHRWLTGLLWVHVPALYVFATLRGAHPAHVLEELVPIVTLGALACISALSHNLRAAATSMGLMTCAS